MKYTGPHRDLLIRTVKEAMRRAERIIKMPGTTPYGEEEAWEVCKQLDEILIALKEKP